MQDDKRQAEKRDVLIEKLSRAGLRITKPRLQLAELLFADGNRHVTAEKLFDEARAGGLSVSQATVYNTLNQFQEAGLLRHVQVDHIRSYFDTNLEAHHHFYVEDDAQLIDIETGAVDVTRLPDTPQGYDVERVEVVVRLAKTEI